MKLTMEGCGTNVIKNNNGTVKRTAGKIVRGRLHAARRRGGNGITRGAWHEGVTTDENRNIVEVHGYTDPDCLFSCHLLNTFTAFL